MGISKDCKHSTSYELLLVLNLRITCLRFWLVVNVVNIDAFNVGLEVIKAVENFHLFSPAVLGLPVGEYFFHVVALHAHVHVHT